MSTMNNEQLYVEGVLSSKAVIQANKRDVLKVLISQKKFSRDIAYLIKLAKERDIEVEFCDVDQLDAFSESKAHGGVLALVGERTYDKLESVLKHKEPFIALLEGIEDPFNFGYCLRSLHAAGCNGVIVGRRNWSDVVNVVTKSSAGASEYMNLIVSDDFTETIQHIKAQGNISVVGANRKDATNLYTTNLDGGLLLLIGGEKRGLSSKVANLADKNIYIPYANDFKNAINGSSATAIISFEVFRRRGKFNAK